METKKPLIDPVIFDSPDQPQNSGLQKAVDFDIRTKSVEEKLYIILYKAEGDDLEGFQKQFFSLCIGRTNAYSDIKEKLSSGIDIDVHRSKIITETKQTESSTGDRKYFLIPYDECITVYAFCIQVEDFYSDDEFNIEDYNTSEVPTEDDITKLPGYMSPEAIEFRRMIDSAARRDKFITDIKRSMSTDGGNV